jgi:hypothetical protein
MLDAKKKKHWNVFKCTYLKLCMCHIIKMIKVGSFVFLGLKWLLWGCLNCDCAPKVYNLLSLPTMSIASIRYRCKGEHTRGRPIN